MLYFQTIEMTIFTKVIDLKCGTLETQRKWGTESGGVMPIDGDSWELQHIEHQI